MGQWLAQLVAMTLFALVVTVGAMAIGMALVRIGAEIARVAGG